MDIVNNQLYLDSIHIFIFNWKNQYTKTKQKELFLKSNGFSVSVINSDELFNEEDWIHLGEDAYFNHQFLKAIELFLIGNKKILLHIQADASLCNKEILNLLSDAILYFNKYNCGIYAPNVDYTFWINNITNTHTFTESNLRTVSNTDCTFWFIKRDIIESLYDLSIRLNYKKYKFGWGYDVICAALCNITNKPIIRDYKYLVDHPKTTNYNKKLANEEWINIKQNLPQILKENIHV